MGLFSKLLRNNNIESVESKIDENLNPKIEISNSGEKLLKITNDGLLDTFSLESLKIIYIF